VSVNTNRDRRTVAMDNISIF